MPTEIFYMIIGWLHPLDVIHLSRSSRFFRTMLMSKNNALLWKAARQNVPGLPDCPQVLAEPRYAAFLFDQYCFACGVERSTTVDYNLALRFCSPCYGANFRSGGSLDNSYRPYITSSKDAYWFLLVAGTADSIRRIPALSGDPSSNHEYHQYYLSEAKAVRHEITRLLCSGDAATMLAFLTERRLYVEQMQTNGRAVAEWRRQRLTDKHEQAQSAKTERSQAIRDKLLSLGYDEGDFPVNNGAWDKILNQPTKLNDRIWKTARPKLLKLIDQEREDRLRAEFEARLKERQTELAPYYHHFVKTIPESDRPFMPNLHDACALPCVAAILSANNAETPVTLPRFTSVVNALRDGARQYIERAKRDLLQWQHEERQRFVREKTPLPTYGPAEVDAELAKATSLFICHHCPLNTSLSARDICTHWRTEHPQLKWNDAWPPNEHEDRRKRPSEWPKKLPWVSAMSRVEKPAKEALAALGLAEDTSHAELDRLVRTGRLVCGCGDPTLPPPQESSWGTLLSHVLAEQSWYDHRTRLLPTHYRGHPGDRLRDDHRPFDACLRLLHPGQHLMIPDYELEREEADEVAAILAAEEHPPACRICHNLTKDSWRFKSLWMPRDVGILAHHMQAKHGERLTKDRLVFKYFPG
ncbi:hypothetical protein OH76DRAFT_709802 [Lentinus brumalis]|uniref:F-box domain-containing protein n=1 Tax=Lentinus brumalis TaxID=2498619 RepID=A0A371D5E6_9APHY|nr:hypothetical protein OH76DRAFT_709802 [Polyporus brumalis]